MEKSNSALLPGVQILRMVAALLVVIYHLTLHAEQWFEPRGLNRLTLFSNVGVDLFFVISGFIIYHVHRADFGNWGTVPVFLAKRVARIFPPYWIILCLTIFFEVLQGDAGSHTSVAGLIQATLLIYGFTPVIVGVSWTLSYEMLFYIGFAVMLPFKRGIALAMLMIWGLTGLVLGADANTMVVSIWVAEFCAGVALAVAVYGRFAAPAWLLALSLAGLLGFGMWSGASVEHQPLHIRVITIMLAIVVVAVAINYRGTGMTRLERPLIKLGEASYAIYLTHYLGIQAVYSFVGYMKRLPHFDAVLFNFVILLPCLLIGGLIFHQYFERPSTLWMRHRLLKAAAVYRS